MDAESFVGGSDWLGPGSLIIITSRDKQVLHQCQVNYVYQVPSLNEKEALQLLTRIGFLKGEEPSDVIILKKVVEYANGNPLALTLLGRLLERKKKPEGEEADADFDKMMNRCLPQEIIRVFKTTYDALSDNERSIFLDIACFFKGEKRDYVIRILEGCGYFPHVGMDRLAEWSLLTISEKETVEMHSFVQDVAREIINSETKQIPRRRRHWESSSIKSLLENKESKGTEVIEGIFLDTTNINFVVNPKAFENMYNLRLLKIYSSSSKAANQELHLLERLLSLPYELRLLHWEKYPLRSLPEDFDPSHLVELNMPYSQLHGLWGGAKILARLKIINLSHSQQLVEVDELSKPCSLVEIDLQGCTSLESILQTDRLKNLQLLNLSGCSRITRTEITKKIKGLDLEGGLRETRSESMVFNK